jgi:hypothetical protein
MPFSKYNFMKKRYKRDKGGAILTSDRETCDLISLQSLSPINQEVPP